MKAPKFSYVRADSLDHALELLDKHGEDARILAGGQSLMPTLNMRLSQPEVLVDINRLNDLKGISLDGDTVVIGALTRHVDVMNSDIVAIVADGRDTRCHNRKRVRARKRLCKYSSVQVPRLGRQWRLRREDGSTCATSAGLATLSRSTPTVTVRPARDSAVATYDTCAPPARCSPVCS